MDDSSATPSTPKITGVSVPVGSSTKRKQESPAQRSENINQRIAPKITPAPTAAAQVQAKKPVTQDEINKFRKDRSKKRKIKGAFAVILLALIIGGGIYVYNYIKDKRYADSAGAYNKDMPIVINDGNNYFLVDTTGKKISSDYSYISGFEADTTVAIKRQDDAQKYIILDKTGNELLNTEAIVSQVNNGKNFTLDEGDKRYLLNSKGEKLSEKYVVSHSQNDFDYTLVRDENRMVIIDADGKEKLNRVLDKFDAVDFAYAKNPYEDISYCAVVYEKSREYSVTVYNCETQKEVKTISEASIYVDFYDKNTSMLTTNNKYYYFYANDLLFESEYPSQELFAGIIQTTDEEGKTLYFDPKDKELREEYPIHSLIAQNKLSKTTEITEECEDYAKSESLNLTNICGNIYKGKDLVSLDYENNTYEFLPENLAKYLSYLGKNYIVRIQKQSGVQSIFDIDKKSVVEGLENVNFYYNTGEYSSFIQAINEPKKLVIYNLISDQKVELQLGSNIEVGSNYLRVNKGNEFSYYNIEGKEIYKGTRGE